MVVSIILIPFFFFQKTSFDSVQQAEDLAKSWGVPYVECSSKTGDHVAEVFHKLLKQIEKDEGLLNENGEAGCAIL